ncbi:YhgE/Pip family protein [Romboutsia sp.]|uniref:YhgE/Pip family protein n=1 Tax=Romboutsia sp. TaxID=1965302 RepID=UPI003F3F5801
MNSIQLLLKEFKNIVKDKKILVQLVAILFVPILYGGMFLWAFWDPYYKLEKLPVAVVNLDKGATFNDKDLNIGKDFVDKLKDDKKFEWKFVDDEKGMSGLKDEDYYMMVKIPSDFSEKATTLLDQNPSKLSLQYVPNESYNFLSSQIGETAILKIKDELSSKLSKTYAETMFDSLKEMSNGIKDASDGAVALNDGTTEAKNGSVKLRDNLETLAKSSIAFEQGMSTAYAGAQDLNKGLTTLNDASSQLINGQQTILNGAKGLQDGSNKLSSGLQTSKDGLDYLNQNMGNLTNGTEKINAGLTNLSSGAGQLSTGAGQLSVGAAGVRDGIVNLQSQLNAILPTLPPAQQAAIKANMGQINALVEGSKSVAAGASNLAQKSTELNKGATSLATGMNELNKGQKQVALGVNQLASGQGQLLAGSQQLAQGQNALSTGVETITGKMQEFDNGVKQVAVGGQSLTAGLGKLEDGAKSIKNGAGLLADGSKDLTSGLNKLNDGTDEMANKLTDASDKTSDIKDTSDKNYDMFASPVNYEIEKVNPVPNYGTGFAPYFLSLGLFIGALILTIIFDIKTPIDKPKNAIGAFNSKFAVILVVGTLQALIADFVLLQGLGLEVKSVQYFIMCSILTSITFLTLIQMLVTWFDNIGRFIAIVLLILQLTTCAGTFPLELIPDQLKGFNAFLPMTYSVRGFKAAISSGNYDFMWASVEKLVIFMVSMCLLSILYFAITLKKKKESLVHENA